MKRSWSQLHSKEFTIRKHQTLFKYFEVSLSLFISCSWCSFPNRYSAIIDETIDIALKKRNEIPPENLTPQDIFYVQVTRIHEFFKSLASVSDETLQQEQIPAKSSQFLLDVSQIVLVRTWAFRYIFLSSIVELNWFSLWILPSLDSFAWSFEIPRSKSIHFQIARGKSEQVWIFAMDRSCIPERHSR